MLSFSLKNPDSGYWRFVCEFTHPEVKKQVNEHSDVHTVFDKGWVEALNKCQILTLINVSSRLFLLLLVLCFSAAIGARASFFLLLCCFTFFCYFNS